jgi:uncharacterized protein
MVSFLSLLTIGYLGLMFFFGVLQDKMIFYPQPVDPLIREQLTPIAFELAVTDNEAKEECKLRGWLQLDNVSKQRPLIIYYGGNGEEVSWNVWQFEQLKTRSFLLMNYRGYGDSEGKPGEQAFYHDALALYDHMVATESVAPEQIVLMGRSLGSGVATWVASQRRVAKLILVTPFDSLTEVASRHFPWLPVSWLLKHRFESIVRAPKIKQPALAVIAGKDQIVPPEHGQRLMAAWGGPQQIQVIPAAGHNDIGNYPEYWQVINEFLGSNSTVRSDSSSAAAIESQ